LDWIEQGLTSHSTHFGSFWRWWGDCGMMASARAHSVCGVE